MRTGRRNRHEIVVNRAKKRKWSSGKERNSHWRAGRGSPIARFAGAAGNPRGRGRSGRLRRRRRDQAGGQAGGGDSRSDGWAPTCSLWLGCAGAVDTEEEGGDAVCLVPLPAPAGCGGRREGGTQGCACVVGSSVAFLRCAPPHSSFHLPPLQFFYMVTFHTHGYYLLL